MAEVRGAALLCGIIRLVDHNIQVASQDTGIHPQQLEVKSTILDKSRESQRPEVTDRRLLRGGELDDLGTQIGGLDGSKVLLVRLGITRILIQEIRRASLNLGIENHLPQLLSRYLLHILMVALVAIVKSVEFVAMAIRQLRTLIGAHKTPHAILLHTLHKQVRNPQSIEQVASPLVLITRVQLQAQKLLDICVPRLEIHRKRSVPLATLVHILCSVVEHLQHGSQTSRLSVRALDLRTPSTDVVDRKPNTACPLGDLRTLCESVVDTLDRVILHVDQKARRKLRVIRARVEQGGSRMNEKALRQRIVCLPDLYAVSPVELNGYAHPHVLGTLPYKATPTAKEISVLKGLKPKIVKHKVAGVIDHALKLQILRNLIIVLGDHSLIKKHLGRVNQTSRRLLLVVVNHQTRSQLAVVRVVTSLHHRTGLGCKLIQLGCLDSILNLRTHLLCDQIRVHMLKSIRKLLNT